METRGADGSRGSPLMKAGTPCAAFTVPRACCVDQATYKLEESRENARLLGPRWHQGCQLYKACTVARGLRGLH